MTPSQKSPFAHFIVYGHFDCPDRALWIAGRDYPLWHHLAGALFLGGECGDGGDCPADWIVFLPAV